MNNRWKNYGLWSAIAGLVLLILQVANVNVIPEQYNAIVNAVLGVFVLAGIISDPTTENKGFGDDK
jgi:phi LC3 family holin